jgi:hypothetical protein
MFVNRTAFQHLKFSSFIGDQDDYKRAQKLRTDPYLDLQESSSRGHTVFI